MFNMKTLDRFRARVFESGAELQKKPKYLRGQKEKSRIGGQHTKPLSQEKGFPGTEALKLDSKLGYGATVLCGQGEQKQGEGSEQKML